MRPIVKATTNKIDLNGRSKHEPRLLQTGGGWLIALYILQPSAVDADAAADPVAARIP